MSIVININSGADFEPVSEGIHSAVLADVVDKGVVQTAFGPKEKVGFTWLTDEADEGGRTKRLFQSFTKSLHEKASLRKAVKQILRKDIDGESFDVEQLIGAQVQLVVQHQEGTDGKIYGNVQAILAPKGPKVAIPQDFQRKKDRPDGFAGSRTPNAVVRNAVKAAGDGRAVAAAVLAPTYRGTDEDIPF